jgi:hypothetical protein
MLIIKHKSKPQAIRNPVRIRGGPAAVIGDGVEFQAHAGHCRRLLKTFGGKADSLRLIREPEDLPAVLSVRLLLMVKGVPSEGWDSFFLWFSVFSSRFPVKEKRQDAGAANPLLRGWGWGFGGGRQGPSVPGLLPQNHIAFTPAVAWFG